MNVDKHQTFIAGETWRGWQPSEYQIHFIHTGVGEAILHIFPDGTTMLIDCGDQPSLTRLELAVPVVPSPCRMAGDWAARYIRRVMPKDCETVNGLPKVDYFVLSHFHSDHLGSPEWISCNWENKDRHLPGCKRSGIALAAEQLSFGKAIDRGWPDYDEPRKGTFPPVEMNFIQNTWAALQKRDGTQIEKFRLGATDQIIPLHRTLDDFSVQNITANGKIVCRDGHIRNLYEERLKNPDNHFNENGMSLGMIIRYGKFSLFTAGDFSDRIIGADGQPFETEDALGEELPPVDVAKINHHGHNSMPEKIVRALAAKVWVACVWDQLHTLDHVLERLSDRNLYPGTRYHFPSVFPVERIKTAADKPFFRDIAPETFGLGAHVIITVPKGGETYRVSCVSPADESMRLLGEYEFESKG